MLITRLAYWYHEPSYMWIKYIPLQAVKLFSQGHHISKEREYLFF